MSISDLEDAYQQLHEQLLRGEVEDEDFKARIEKLRFEDSQGRQWRMGWYTGKWYRYDRGQWIPDRPQEGQAGDRSRLLTEGRRPADSRWSRRPVAIWPVAGLVGLLLMAGALLVVGWNAGWWATSTGETTGTATSTALRPTGTPPLSSSLTATSSPSPGRSATATTMPTTTRRMPTTATARTSPTVGVSSTSAPSPAPSSTPRAQPSPTASLAGRVLFPVYDPDPQRRTFDIYQAWLDSGRRELLVAQASQPAISPNGKRLAYRSWNPARRGIVVRELADGNTWVWINYTEAARPSWSPDSENIVFPSQQEPDREWRIYRTLGLESDRVRRHGGDILGRMPIWLADGRIVYWECALNECGLHVMQGDGTGPIRLTTYEHDMAPAASPDGHQIAFMSSQSGNWEIYVVASRAAREQAGQEPKRLTHNDARDGLPTWSPDGRWLAFATDREGTWAIWIMRPGGSGAQKLFDLGGSLEGEIAGAVQGEQHGWTWETIAWGP